MLYFGGLAAGCAGGLICKVFLSMGRDCRFLWNCRQEDILNWEKKDFAVFLAAVFGGVYGIWIYESFSLAYLDFMLLLMLLLPLAFLDWEEHMVPDTHLIMWLAAVILSKLIRLQWPYIVSCLAGGAAGGVILGLAYLLRRDSVGLGDVKLLALCGLVTGFPGVIYLLVRGLLASLVYAAVLLAGKRAGLKSEIPFVPFLLVGALL